MYCCFNTPFSLVSLVASVMNNAFLIMLENNATFIRIPVLRRVGSEKFDCVNIHT